MEIMDSRDLKQTAKSRASDPSSKKTTNRGTAPDRPLPNGDFAAELGGKITKHNEQNETMQALPQMIAGQNTKKNSEDVAGTKPVEQQIKSTRSNTPAAELVKPGLTGKSTSSPIQASLLPTQAPQTRVGEEYQAKVDPWDKQTQMDRYCKIQNARKRRRIEEAEYLEKRKRESMGEEPVVQANAKRRRADTKVLADTLRNNGPKSATIEPEGMEWVSEEQICQPGLFDTFYDPTSHTLATREFSELIWDPFVVARPILNRFMLSCEYIYEQELGGVGMNIAQVYDTIMELYNCNFDTTRALKAVRKNASEIRESRSGFMRPTKKFESQKQPLKTIHELQPSNLAQVEAPRKALARFRMLAEHPEDLPFGAEEQLAFDHAILYFGKKFHIIQKKMFPDRSVRELIVYYFCYFKQQTLPVQGPALFDVSEDAPSSAGAAAPLAVASASNPSSPTMPSSPARGVLPEPPLVAELPLNGKSSDKNNKVVPDVHFLSVPKHPHNIAPAASDHVATASLDGNLVKISWNSRSALPISRSLRFADQRTLAEADPIAAVTNLRVLCRYRRDGYGPAHDVASAIRFMREVRSLKTLENLRIAAAKTKVGIGASSDTPREESSSEP